jgi:hypothetical protein
MEGVPLYAETIVAKVLDASKKETYESLQLLHTLP